MSTTPATYRKRPVIVEAMQLIDDLGNHMAVAEWIVDNGGVVIIPPLDPHLVITTLEGDMRAEIGDWIIRGTKGEFYPCKPDIFDATYEPVVAVATMAGPSYRAFIGESPCDDPNCPCHPKPSGGAA